MSDFLCKWSWLVEFEPLAVGHGEGIQDGLPTADLARRTGVIRAML